MEIKCHFKLYFHASFSNKPLYSSNVISMGNPLHLTFIVFGVSDCYHNINITVYNTRFLWNIFQRMKYYLNDQLLLFSGNNMSIKSFSNNISVVYSKIFPQLQCDLRIPSKTLN